MKALRTYYCCLVAQWYLTLCKPCTIALQAPKPMGFPMQEYWSGLPFPSPRDFPDPAIKHASPVLGGGFFTTEPPGKPRNYYEPYVIITG